ncbi:hypothetical protein FE633_04620 [Streptomyces montanus]|uniref:Uncharacterized protein n=1 Tax=Streptomyces montanus TaxID=2580423 RepID=A0A5R9FX94_9ACTN|nr:hypothetical protein [Streptomyces montanus]TLS47319.1 hypothetical protein FE633_04620 [Streptomyces montanus]
MLAIRLDQQTHDKVVFAARVMGCTPSEVIRRLVELWSTAEEADDEPKDVPVHAVYRGTRVTGLFDPATRSLKVTDGPGAAGQTYPSPSAAAMAVIHAVNPERTSPHANGWSFWRVTRSGEEIKSLRRPPRTV